MALQQMLRHVRSTPATAFAKGFATSASMLAIGDLLCQGIQKGGVKALASECALAFRRIRQMATVLVPLSAQK